MEFPYPAPLNINLKHQFMKRLLLIAILFSALSSLQAQKKATFGIGAGINVSDISDSYQGQTYPTSSRVAFKGYVFADLLLAKHFSIETDLGYDGLGFKAQDQNSGTNVDFTMNYLTLSVLPKIHIKQSGVAFFAGPALGILLNSKETALGTSISQDIYNSVDVFLPFGMEYISPVGLGISFRIMPGLTNVGKTTNSGETLHNVAVGINLVYQFQ